MWTKAVAAVELWEETGTTALELFTSKGLFIESMAEVPSWGCWGLKVLVNGINYSPEGGAICLKWTWHLYGLCSVFRKEFKIAAGKLGFFFWWHQVESVRLCRRAILKGRNALFTPPITEETIKGNKFYFYTWAHILSGKYTLNPQFGP